MKNKYLIYISAIVVTLNIIFGNCGFSPHEDESAALFFTSKRFNGDYWKSFPLLSPDTIVRHIHDEVPPKWHSIACEAAFFLLDSQHEDTPDSVFFKLLDNYDKTFQNDSIRAFSQMIRGELFTQQGRFDTARICLENSYTLSQKNNHPIRGGDIKRSMGILALRENNYAEAVHQLLETYTIYGQLDTLRDDGRRFELLMSLGVAYRGGNDYQEAQIWHQRAWAHALKTNLLGYKIRSAAAIADNYLNLNNLDSAKIMIDTAFYIQNLSKNDYNYDEATRYLILAKTDLALGDCSAAFAHFKEAKARNKGRDNALTINRYDKGLADGYLCLGQLDSAFMLYNKALISSDTVGKIQINKQLSKLYAQRKDYARALLYEQKSKQLTDRIFTIEKSKAIGQVEEKKKAEKHLDDLNKRQKTLKMVGFIVLIILILGLIKVLHLAVKQRQLKEIGTQEKKTLEAREQRKTDALQAAESSLVDKNKALQVAKTALVDKDSALRDAETQLADKDVALKEADKLLTLKNGLINDLEARLNNSTETAGSVSPNSTFIKIIILTHEDWLRFRESFDKQFPDFILRLKARFPLITSGELRLFLLIKLGFNATEVANITGISERSVYIARYRLRQRLGLTKKQDLEGFIQSFS